MKTVSVFLPSPDEDFFQPMSSPFGEKRERMAISKETSRETKKRKLLSPRMFFNMAEKC